MIDIIIVDDQQMVREGLKMILSLHEEVRIIGEAANGAEAMELLTYMSPDVVLMDVKMPRMDGMEATKLMKANYPEIKVIILTTFNDNEYIFTGLKNGADGYILKDAGSTEIMASIRSACEGNILLHPQITREVVNALNAAHHSRGFGLGNTPDKQIRQLLTPRELEVAQGIMEGKSNKAISNELFITEGTVKNYVSKMLEKLEVKNRTELTLLLQQSI